MNPIIKLIIPLISFFFIYNNMLLSKNVGQKNKCYSISNIDKNMKHIVLLGASIGRAWDIPSLPERVNNNNYLFEYVGCSGFDKSDCLRKIISRTDNKPDAIFIKECAAYFPGDLNHYQSLMKKWIKECYEKDVIPIPTTVVPVTRLHSLKKFLIDIIKGRNPFESGSLFHNKRNKAILKYNDWIKAYCKRCELSVLDLEGAVRYSEKNRYLREDLAKIDGLHLNSKAYKALDKIVISTLKRLNWENKNACKEDKT
ncbi:MAG: hypothetical protein ACTSRG_26915 [Candidatus Helarchaeota archaeon]